MTDALPRQRQSRFANFLFAIRKMEIQRPSRRASRSENLLQSRAVITLLAKQLGRGGERFFSGIDPFRHAAKIPVANPYVDRHTMYVDLHILAVGLVKISHAGRRAWL